VGIISELPIIKPSLEVNVLKNITAGLYFEKAKYANGTESTGFGGSGKEIYKLTGWGIMPEVRFYPFTKKRTAPYGFFGGLYIRYRKLTERFDGVPDNSGFGNHKIHIETSATAFNNGIAIGYKFIYDVLLAEATVGYGAAWGTWENPDERKEIPKFYKTELSGFENALRFEISVGLVFPKYRRVYPSDS